MLQRFFALAEFRRNGHRLRDRPEVKAVWHLAVATINHAAPPFLDQEVSALQREDVVVDGIEAASAARQLRAADRGHRSGLGPVSEQQALQEQAGAPWDCS